MQEQETPEQIQQISTRKKAMLLALEDSYGIVTPAAKVVGIDRGTHYNWYNTDPVYKDAVDDLKNVAIDHSESKLHELIDGVLMAGFDGDGEQIVYKKEPNVSAVIFHLKTIGKGRGYTEKQENGNDENTIPIEEFTKAVVSATGGGIIPPAKSGVDEQPDAT